MIRFVDVRGQGLDYRFSFWDTINGTFVSFSGSVAWDSFEDFKSHFETASEAEKSGWELARFERLCPAWVHDGKEDSLDDFWMDKDVDEELRRDAERWLHLRNLPDGIEFRDAAGAWRADCPSGDELQAIVDVALAQKAAESQREVTPFEDFVLRKALRAGATLVSKGVRRIRPEHEEKDNNE